MSDLREQRRAEVLREIRAQRDRRSRSVARRVALLRAASDSRVQVAARR